MWRLALRQELGGARSVMQLPNGAGAIVPLRRYGGGVAVASSDPDRDRAAKELRQKGFAVLRGLLTVNEVADLRREIERMMLRGPGCETVRVTYADGVMANESEALSPGRKSPSSDGSGAEGPSPARGSSSGNSMSVAGA